MSVAVNKAGAVLHTFILTASIVLLLVCPACKRPELFREAKFQIGTVVTLSAYGSDQAAIHEAFVRAFAEVERLGALMGNDPSSDVSRINDAAAGTAVTISPETAALIATALDLSLKSQGAFDISFAPVGKLWDYKAQPFVVPDKETVAASLKNVGYKNLTLNGSSVIKTRDGLAIGLGAIAKGYIIDSCVEVMRASGIEDGIVDAGGDIRVFGKKGNRNWVAAVRHPRDTSGLLMSFPLSPGEACATSGDYERFAIAGDGKRYHHIIDPRSGYPADNFISVTVIGTSAMIADARATAFFVMGLEQTKEFLRQTPDCEVILIDQQMRCYASSSLKKRIQLIDKSLLIEWF